MNNRLINTKVAGGGGCTDIVDNYDPFDGNGVALYQLNGNANDVSGNYNGTATNVTYGTGVFGQAGIFNGSSSSISLGTNSPLNNFTGEQTISVWLYPTASKEQFVIGYRNDSTTKWNGIRLNDDETVQFLLRDGASISVAVSSNTVNLNQWNHVAITVDNSNINIYINNAAETSSNSVSSVSSTEETGIGYLFQSGGEQPFDGSIDQVRIFDTALTPLEVEALYTEELCICDGTVDTLDILGDGSCIATYQLDGNANDLSGNYSGTPTDVSYGVGEFDLAGVFNGSTSVITLPSAINTLLGNKVFSVSLWVKDNGSVSDTVFSSGGANTFFLSANWTSAGNYALDNGSGSGTVVLGAVTNDWVHIVLNSNGSSGVEAFLNGVSKGTLAYRNADDPITTIGNLRNIGFYFTGSIDQVRIFNKALNSSEVTTLYNETACTKAACTGTTNTLDILGDGSCIATYPLDGSPADLSGNYNGVQTDVTYPVGEFDLAASFNGSTSRIDIAPPVQQQALSVSAWVNYTSADPYRNIWRFEVLPLDPPVGTSLFLLTHPSGQIGVSMASSQTFRFNYIHPTTNLNDGQWHHVVFSWDGTTNTNAVKLYIDEVVATSTSTIPASSMAVYDTFNFARDWNGNLDQVRVFNKALSAGEVTTLNNETPCN